MVWGDSADEQLLRNLGLDHATVEIVTFADPDVAVGIVKSVRRVRADVPVLVRSAGRFAPGRARARRGYRRSCRRPSRPA